MLKRLELVGFKSFADKTRLDFEPGISAVVGPNGSGKSNIVDAIRWILGEQSAKSLRGKEMADVIFNGSGTRRSHGMAEVSLYLDNSRRYLPTDRDEVVLSRRVYRSGESEYFLNGQTVRLRDIRDLFLDTGAGHHAYSIIEQGKVDQILQASNKDRRHIFDEASGISRFKARKIEALRRLERVQQNLVRVQDIHEELDRQLRGLRSQAGKARRFRELADRLRLLRLASGADDYSRMTLELGQIEALLGPTAEQITRCRASLVDREALLAELEETLTGKEEAYRAFTTDLANLREDILTRESEAAKDQARAAELERATNDAFAAITQGQSKLREIRQRLSDTQARRVQADGERLAHLQAWESGQRDLSEIDHRIDQIRIHVEGFANECQSQIQQLNRLENEQSALESQLSLLWQQQTRITQRLEEWTANLDAARRQSSGLLLQQQSVRSQWSASVDQAGAISASHRTLLENRRELLERLAQERQLRTTVAGRMDILEQLRARHEGMDAGVRTILSQREQSTDAWPAVLGVLGDMIAVAPELADIVELALGSRAQSLVVAHPESLTEDMLETARRLPGRVQFVAIEDASSDHLVVVEEQVPWPTVASLVGCDEVLRPLVDRLLGQTYLADDFDMARAMATRAVDLRFITRSGDILDPDGSVSTGPTHKTAGILARSAEIRTLRSELEEVNGVVNSLEAQGQDLEDQIRNVENALGEQDLRRNTMAEQLRHLDARWQQTQEASHGFARSLEENRRERDRVAKEILAVDQQYLVVEGSLARAHDAIARGNDELATVKGRLTLEEAQRSELVSRLHEHQTRLAVADERLTALHAEERQLVAESLDRQTHIEETHRRLADLQSSHRDVQRRWLARVSDLATRYADKDHLALSHGVDAEDLAVSREDRRKFTEEAGQLRRQIAADQERAHSAELRRTELRMSRETLSSRIAEDYGVDLAVYRHEPVDPVELSRDDIHREVEDLRSKISKLGTVNAEAASELDDLERRARTFQYQIDDLNTARRHLEQLIGRINEECRRLFLDTFENVREHFQELFRKLFGGGKADLLLEDETDVLETGIEILARPPGKEPQSISLLSGGEKTLTAVALVMAIFRSKPSPFCILDEVDAALDEANIGRFVQLLREFTSISQFILITHSKTTMSAADVLHGITQRESGVSIRVSVRWEDVEPDGHFVHHEAEDDQETHEPAA